LWWKEHASIPRRGAGKQTAADAGGQCCQVSTTAGTRPLDAGQARAQAARRIESCDWCDGGRRGCPAYGLFLDLGFWCFGAPLQCQCPLPRSRLPTQIQSWPPQTKHCNSQRHPLHVTTPPHHHTTTSPIASRIHGYDTAARAWRALRHCPRHAALPSSRATARDCRPARLAQSAPVGLSCFSVERLLS
jgi:hypothetical protein